MYVIVDPTISESQVRRLSMLRPEDVFTPEVSKYMYQTNIIHL
jgi:hypothetical protein